MKVREIMTHEVRSAAPGDTLQHVARIMSDEDVGAVPVLEDGELCGIITDRDIVVRCIAEGKDPSKVKVDEVTTEDVQCIEPDASVEEASRMMADSQVRRLPVAENGRLVGMLSIGDIAVKHADEEVSGETLEEISQGVKESGDVEIGRKIIGRQPGAPHAGGRQQIVEQMPGRRKGAESRMRAESTGEVDREISTGGKRQGISSHAAGEEQKRQARVVPIRGEGKSQTKSARGRSIGKRRVG